MFNDSGEPAINTLVISTSQYGEYDKWQDAGEPAGNAIPKGYGTVIQKLCACSKGNGDVNSIRRDF